MKISNILNKFSLISLAVLTVGQSCFAGTGIFSNVREHGEWITGSFAIDGQKTARLGSKYTQNNVGIFLDFLNPELYLIEIIRTKDVPDRGMDPKYYLADMTIAVDNKYSISFEAKCAEDETVHECYVPQSKNDELIRQFKKGNEVNFKIGDFDLYFSLSGFSKAFYRASSLVK